MSSKLLPVALALIGAVIGGAVGVAFWAAQHAPSVGPPTVSTDLMVQRSATDVPNDIRAFAYLIDGAEQVAVRRDGKRVMVSAPDVEVCVQLTGRGSYCAHAETLHEYMKRGLQR